MSIGIDKQEVLDQFRDPERRTSTYENLRLTGPESPNGRPGTKSDTQSIRNHFGVAPYDGSQFDFEHIVPNILEHMWHPNVDQTAGGTDLLAVGKPGSGKSTLGNALSERVMEINDEKVVWRGSPSRSEWLPLAPWTRLCLPSGVSINITLEPVNPTSPEIEINLEELQEIVREVVRYDDPLHLNNELLSPGMFHVVYPDPSMRRCQEIYEMSAEKVYESPKGREKLFHPEDPSGHWWFAWFLARVEHGPHSWTTLILDEIGDIAPQAARNDQFGSYQKIELLKDAWVDARKKGLSVFLFGHAESDIHDMIRKKIRWRVAMPGSANPTSKGEVVGFSNVPMDQPITRNYPVGRAVFYNERNFEQKVAWDDYSIEAEYKLKLEVAP